MPHIAIARALSHEVNALLHRHGYFVQRGSDMTYWGDMIRSRGGWVNPTFMPELHPEPAEWFMIFAGDGRFVATIAWRVLQTDDYVARMRAGTEWSPDAAALGYQEWPIGPAPLIAGRVHDRGGIFVDPALRGQSRFSWYLTGMHLTMFVQDGGDFVVSHTLPKVTEGKLPRYVYGYDQVTIMPEHTFPWHAHPFASAMVWSSAEAVRQEVARRLRFLRQYHGHDLGDIARAWERYQRAIEASDPADAAAVQERDTRSA